VEGEITITDGVVHLVGMEGMVVLLPGMAVVALPVGTTEVEGEGALRHEALGMLQPLDGLMPQQGQIEPLPVEVQDEIPTAMTVRLTLR